MYRQATQGKVSVTYIRNRHLKKMEYFILFFLSLVKRNPNDLQERHLTPAWE